MFDLSASGQLTSDLSIARRRSHGLEATAKRRNIRLGGKSRCTTSSSHDRGSPILGSHETDGKYAEVLSDLRSEPQSLAGHQVPHQRTASGISDLDEDIDVDDDHEEDSEDYDLDDEFQPESGVGTDPSTRESSIAARTTERHPNRTDSGSKLTKRPVTSPRNTRLMYIVKLDIKHLPLHKLQTIFEPLSPSIGSNYKLPTG